MLTEKELNILSKLAGSEFVIMIIGILANYIDLVAIRRICGLLGLIIMPVFFITLGYVCIRLSISDYQSKHTGKGDGHDSHTK